MTPSDYEIVRALQQADKKVFYAVNKIDSEKQENLFVDFYALGVDPLYPVSAMTGYGADDLIDAVLDEISEDVPTNELETPDPILKVAVVGRPNVGKSTLINLLLGEERLVANPEPGTTRDSIDTIVRHYGKEYLFIDTAGIRRRSRIVDRVEKYSVIKAFRSIDRADIVLVLMDSAEGVTDQDARIAGYAFEKGRGVILLLNKWDTVQKDSNTVSAYFDHVRASLKYLQYTPILTISALTGTRAPKIFGLINELESEFKKRITTGELNRFLEDTITGHPPGLHRTKPIKIYYLTQIRVGPPTFVFICNFPESIHFSYKRFMENRLREGFAFGGSPLKLIFKKKPGRTSDPRRGKKPRK